MSGITTSVLREALRLTREEFVTRFQLSLDDVMAWEEGRVQPNPGLSYAKVRKTTWHRLKTR